MINPILEQECVYSADKDGTFHVACIFMDDMDIVIKTNKEMSITEVQQVLNGFEKDLLGRVNIPLANHQVKLNMNGKMHNVAFDGNHTVKGFEAI
ncbi:MAG: hypothetical protein FWC78_01435 [Defluviitaleaceae bacterium]|nr:hypothetical protein [Defluviitaleaceae bacterium]